MLDALRRASSPAVALATILGFMREQTGEARREDDKRPMHLHVAVPGSAFRQLVRDTRRKAANSGSREDGT